MKLKLFNLTIFNLKNLMNLKNLIFCNLIIFNLINLQSGNAQMCWNHAASFAGTSSSYIVVKNSSSLNITGSFTLEAWVNPNNVTSQAGIIKKGSYFYGMSMSSSGRIYVYTNGSTRLISKPSTTLPINQWTHISATHNHYPLNPSSFFALYINGEYDTSVTLNGNFAPVSNTDSLYIGERFIPFSGMMDEVRIWNRYLISSEVSNNFRISLGTNGGRYNGLVMSMTFQAQASSSFTTYDYSNAGNHGSNCGATAVDLSNIPSKTILPNLSVKFGTNNYLAGPDNTAVSPTTAVTLQAWIKPYLNSNSTIIHKGHPSGAVTNYSLNIINTKLAAKINGIVFDSQDTIPLDEWTHVSFAYFLNGVGSVFGYRFCVNGKFVKLGNLTATNIADGADSLYIGGTPGLPDFPGSIDEVRISNYAKSIPDINDSLYMPMESVSYSTAAYNCDGYTWCNTGLYGPFLYFRGGASFNTVDGITPLNKGVDLNFQKGFYMKPSDHRIPQSGNDGVMVDDTINVFLDEIISDVNVYVALDHGETSELTIDLIPPGGGRIYLANFNSTLAPSKYIATIFDDQAATSLSNNTYTSLSPVVRSSGNILNLVNGTSAKGMWTLKIRDFNSSGNVGRLYAWGIQFNNKWILPKVLSCTNLMQGFYNPASNLMIRDTMRCYLRSFPSPYAKIDSSKVYLQTNGSASFVFTSLAVTNFTSYYLQLKHRNSIETWSKNLMVFPSLISQLSYDFTTDSAKAFGNNLIRVDNSPVEFAIYNGDVNQDGVVDATDASAVENDAFNFLTGYVSTDVDGNNFVDATDAALVGNNAFNFVTKITP